MYSLTVFVPEDHKEKLKEALFKAGAGRYKNYDGCCWETEGIGQFRPLKNSNPYLGEKNKLKRVKEYRIEMICEKEIINRVIKALNRNHPYEEPAFYIYKLENF